MKIDADSARIKVPPPLVFVGALIAGVALGRVLGRPEIPFLPDRSGWVLVVAGAAIILTATGLFRKAGTDSKPWKTTTSIVTDGVYRWTRNPMYLGMALIYAGLALVADSLAALLLLIPVVIVIQKEVIEREEAYLEAKFGTEYLTYKATVRRWV
jgi:protein-S-isoprenylcysteine O-methyltransferase Ste14